MSARIQVLIADDYAVTHSLAESFGTTRLLEKSTLTTRLVDAIHECMSQSAKGERLNLIDSLS
jgi:hypothetical protein